MPGDVAVEWPDTWVVLLELYDHVAISCIARCGQDLDIAKLSVVCIGDSSVPSADTSCKDIEVMAMEMLKHSQPSTPWICDQKIHTIG